ncbi:MAG TPA: ABATE domain-containing protein [Bauldia sp.]|nr:ABATE domain-containing protein [Bauldia sp.]
MTVSSASTMSLVGGALALDFANTGSAREPEGTTEHLLTPTDLVDWARHAGGVDAATAKRLRSAIAVETGTGERLLRHARELRRAIYDAGSAIANRQPPGESDLKTLKTFAVKALSQSALKSQAEGRYAFAFSDAEPEAATLGPIVWSMIDLLGARDFDRLKQCPECGWLFFDHSKNNSRRWCDMATCGNRTKLRRHRKHA